jgi:MFS transporter, ACDE family, multidrug resistance protein
MYRQDRNAKTPCCSLSGDKSDTDAYMSGPSVSDNTPGQWSLAILYFLATMPRALLISLLPVLALRLFGDAQKVSVFYMLVSIAGICASISVPLLSRRIGASGVFALGAGTMIISMLLFSQPGTAAFTGGMLAFVFGYAAMDISLTLFLLMLIPRAGMSYFEPKRVVFTASAYIIGPWLGIWLHTEISAQAPMWTGLACALAAMSFGVLRGFSALSASRSARPGNPLTHLRRFWSQPRLRLAWALTFGRAAWWTMFFIYTPIYAVSTGLGEVTGGAVVSTGVAIVLTVPLFGRLGRRIGLRRMMRISCVMAALCMLLTAALAPWPWLGAAALLLCAFAVTPLDAAGNIPFLRTVRSRERNEMTGVFATYRDAAQLGPPALFAGLLQVFALPSVYVASAAGLLIMASFTRYLPRRL